MAFGGLGLYYYNEDGTQLHYYWSDMKSDNIYDKYIESGKSEPIKSGYEFKGWSYNGELLPDTTTVDSIGLSDVNISLYAVFGIPDNTKCILEKGAVDIIVDKIKNSGGETPETCTVTIYSKTEMRPFYLTSSGWNSVVVYGNTKTIEVLKNSFICFENNQCTSITFTGSIEELWKHIYSDGQSFGIYGVTGDGTINVFYEGGGPI